MDLVVIMVSRVIVAIMIIMAIKIMVVVIMVIMVVIFITVIILYSKQVLYFPIWFWLWEINWKLNESVKRVWWIVKFLFSNLEIRLTETRPVQTSFKIAVGTGQVQIPIEE